MDLTGLSAYLLSLGGPGALILWLLYERSTTAASNSETVKALRDQLSECREAHMLDIRENLSRTTAGLQMASEFIRANNTIQDKAADSASRLGIGIAGLDNMLDNINKTLERVEDQLRSYRR